MALLTNMKITAADLVKSRRPLTSSDLTLLCLHIGQDDCSAASVARPVSDFALNSSANEELEACSARSLDALNIVFWQLYETLRQYSHKFLFILRIFSGRFQHNVE